jgi:DNA-directed RNA polymerase subunit RPC12/RpoP
VKKSKQCPECDSRGIYKTQIDSKGGYGPDLLPGVHPWYRTGKLEVYVCGRCGYYQLFVLDKDLPALADSQKFTKNW